MIEITVSDMSIGSGEFGYLAKVVDGKSIYLDVKNFNHNQKTYKIAEDGIFDTPRRKRTRIL